MKPNILYNAVTAGGLLAMRATDAVKRICAVLVRTIEGKTACLSPRRKKTSVAICLGLIWLSLGQVSQAAEPSLAQGSQAAVDQRAQENVDRVSRLLVRQSSIATVDMQITKVDWQRTISMQLWTLRDTNVLVRIRQPQEDAGIAILKVGAKAWIYLPKANRTVTMPASMMTTSWMGSHFTLDDLVSQSRLSDNYAIATSFAGQRDGVAVFEYTLTPKSSAAVVWGKIVMEVRESDLMPVWQRYYDEDGKPVRELSFSEYKTISGRLIPTRLVMRPLDQAAEQSTITYESIAFDTPIGAETFSLSKLKQ
jgi:outer membrane lipoprotein-sorting protein